MKKKNKFLWLIVAALSVLAACQKDWEQHNAVTDANLTKTLQQTIAANPALSKWSELVSKSAYATVLSSSKNFTVFAPTNDALASLDPAMVSDTAMLNKFVGNHIADLRFFTVNATDTIRILMLNGKYNNMKGKLVEEANISTADVAAKNGALHIIDKYLPYRLNVWEIVSTTSEIPAKQRALMLKMNYDGFDATLAEQVGVDPVTGLPVYKPGTGLVKRNKYWDRVYDLRAEEPQFTFFAIADGAYDSEALKYNPFFVTGSTDSTNDLSGFTVIRDFAIKGYYDQASLPDTLISKFNVKIPIDKAAIIKKIKASNGVVYIMSKVDVAPKEKFKVITIQGENPTGTSHDRRSNTFYRDRTNALTGLPYRDMLVSGHGVALFNIRYRLSDMPSMKYKAYWVAVNDFQTATFTQRFAPGFASNTVFPYTTIAVNNQAEVLIGEFTISSYMSVYDIFLVAANSTTAAANSVVCDYIKLVPSL